VKNTWKDFFTFSRKEQGGIIVMLALLLALGAIHPFIPLFVKNDPKDMEEFKKQARAYMEELRKLDSTRTTVKSFRPSAPKNDSSLVKYLKNPFYFNPNNASKEDLLRTGLSEYVAGNIIRYREKGGQFRTLKDFRKIYGMEEDWFSSVELYISLPVQSEGPGKDGHDTARSIVSYKNDYLSDKYIRKKVYIELNSADSISLDSLTGIGPSFARRIISYREILGGYYTSQQLLEIKGMDTARYAQFQSEVYADPALVRKIDINAVTFKELMRHPYFEYYIVKAIINHRDKKKRIDSVGELKTLPEIYPELFQKISPYLKVK
jgi:DNA uptake protein ComE-like DNA-binding protein